MAGLLAEWDADEDEGISMHELARGLPTVGLMHASKELVADIFEMFDQDSSGAIT
jgi:Ca2+-binding EF-hand superfamily protein